MTQLGEGVMVGVIGTAGLAKQEPKPGDLVIHVNES
jgi:hypothetical protein